MELRVWTDRWASFFAALGLVPLAACGARTIGEESSTATAAVLVRALVVSQ